MLSFGIILFVLSFACAQEPGLGVTSGSFQCFRGWYQELENFQGLETGDTWNLGAAYHDEGTVCGGYGSDCPSSSIYDMREIDAQNFILSTTASHYPITAYEIHDHSVDCPPLRFCVQPLSDIYFKTRAYWQVLWRYTGDKVDDRLCVRTQYPGYVWLQGISLV
jgi:hypothetical protein